MPIASNSGKIIRLLVFHFSIYFVPFLFTVALGGLRLYRTFAESYSNFLILNNERSLKHTQHEALGSYDS